MYTDKQYHHHEIDVVGVIKLVHFVCCKLSVLLFVAVAGAGQSEVEQHLEMGKKLLAAGQLADALSHYHAAVGQYIVCVSPVCLCICMTYNLCVCVCSVSMCACFLHIIYVTVIV